MSVETMENVQPFLSQSKSILSKGKELASSVDPGSVQVWPGGATFTTIQAAINSITGAGPQVQYQVAVGAGTFNESITMKDYVYVVGSGVGNTIITAQGQDSNNIVGVVNSASHCGISEVTIIATGGGWGTWPVGIKIMGAGLFHISGAAITSSDSNLGGNNVRGITNNTGSYTGNVIVGDTTMQVSGAAETTAVGIEAFGLGGNFSLFINLCTIDVEAQESFGVSTAVTASAVLDSSKIIAGTWALYNSDGSAPITANQCTIDGPVSAGVVVNN